MKRKQNKILKDEKLEDIPVPEQDKAIFHMVRNMPGHNSSLVVLLLKCGHEVMRNKEKWVCARSCRGLCKMSRFVVFMCDEKPLKGDAVKINLMAGSVGVQSMEGGLEDKMAIRLPFSLFMLNGLVV